MCCICLLQQTQALYRFYNYDNTVIFGLNSNSNTVNTIRNVLCCYRYCISIVTVISYQWLKRKQLYNLVNVLLLFGYAFSNKLSNSKFSFKRIYRFTWSNAFDGISKIKNANLIIFVNSNVLSNFFILYYLFSFIFLLALSLSL